MNLTAEPKVVKVDMSTAHFSEAAVFGGRPHRYPAWLCWLLHKRHFIGCWSRDKEWGSHVLCGYCQRCRHFDYQRLRLLWMPAEAKPHRFHIVVNRSQSEIKTNELYLLEVFTLIETLACVGRDNETHGGHCELSVEMTSTNGSTIYEHWVNTLDKQARLRVLSHLCILYQHAMEGSTILPVEQHWWNKI